MRLSSKSDLAELAGVSRAAVTKACRGKLAGAVSGTRVDLDHAAVRDWLASKGRAEPAERPTRANGSGRDVEVTRIEDYYDLTLRELVDRYGTVQAFSDWLDSVRKMELIRGTRLDNEEASGSLIRRDMVEKHLIGLIDGLCRRLLSDAAKTIAARSVPIVRSGSGQEDVERVVVEVIGATIRPVKEELVQRLTAGR